MDFRHRKNSFLFKSLTSFLIVSFAINQVAFGNPVEVKITPSAAPGITASLEDFVTVSDIYSPQSRTSTLSDILHNKSVKAVIYIENAHGNISAQRNIAEALQLVSQEAKLGSPWIALEGTGVMEVDHRVLSAFPDETIRKKTSEYFLMNGEINGADYFAGSSNPKARLFGVDEDGLAKANRESYRQYLDVKAETDRALEHLRNAADFLKKKIYYGDLVLWDSSVQQFEYNPNHFLKHLAVLEELAGKNKVSLANYPHIKDLIELKTLEAQSTQAGLKKDIQTFQEKSRASDLSPDGIRTIWKKNKNAFDLYLQLKNHARFLEISSRLEGVSAFQEVAEASDALWNKLLSYREARDAFDIDRVVSFYEKLFDFGLLPEEYGRYKKDEVFYSPDALAGKIADYNFLLHPKSLRPSSEEVTRLKDAVKWPLSFYRTAEKRNEYLVRNLLSLLDKAPQKKTFFIAGGFHKQAITQDLKAKKIPYIVLSPKISDSKGSEGYWKKMGGATTQLDLVLAALSTVELEDSFGRDPFRDRVGLAQLSLLGLMGPSGPGERQELLKDFKSRVSPRDGKVIEALSRDIHLQGDRVRITFPGYAYEASLEGPEKDLRITGASLGQSFVAVNMEKAAALLKAKSLDPGAFRPMMIQPFQGAPLLSYDYFRDKVLEYLIKTANEAGLPISLPLQRQLLDLMFPAAVQGQPVEKAERTKFETSLQHLPSHEAISFQFNSSSYLFSGGVKEKQILINVPALQSLQSETNEYVVNVLFAAIIYYQMIYQQGNKSRIEDTTKLFYKALDTLVQAIESKQKVKLGYQGTAVEKWFSTVVENNVENAESANLFSNIIRSVNRTGFAPGMRLKDRFKITRFLDQGGMGAVWQAVDMENNNLVVVKQVLPSALHNPAMRGRFYREIRALGRNQHNPHIAKLLAKQIPEEDVADETEPNERVYYVMEWAPGTNLEQLVRRGDLKLEESVNIVIQLLRGLEQVHKTQTIHRDLKPLNIKVDTQNHNFVRFFDFGLARRIDEPDDTNADKEISITQAGDVIGSPQYMSPEQATGAKDKVTYTTDIFSVGSILYRLITGALPFDGPNTQAVLMKVATMDYKPLPPDIPKALQAIVRKALTKEPADRYQSAGEFAQDLENFLKGGATQTAQSGDKMSVAAKAGTARQSPLDASKKRLGQGKVDSRKQAGQQNPKSALSWPWMAGGAALVAVIGGVLMMGRGKDNVKPPVDNPPVVVQKDDPAEIARKQEVEKQRIAQEAQRAIQRELAKQLGDFQVGLGELNATMKSLDSILGSMKENGQKIQVLADQATQSLDNIPAVEQADAEAKKLKKQIDNQVFTADEYVKTFNSKLRDIKDKIAALQGNQDFSVDQVQELNILRREIGEKEAAISERSKSIAVIQTSADEPVKSVSTTLAAAKDPVRGKEIMINAEIKRLQGLVAELLKEGDLKGLDDVFTPLADLRAKLGDKSKELMKLYADISTEVVRQSKLAEVKEGDRKTLQDLEAKLQPLSDEFKALTDSIPPALKVFEDPFAVLNDQIIKIDKSVTAVGEIAKGDPKFTGQLAETQNKAAEAKPVRDALVSKKTVFDKAASDLKDRSLAFSLDNKVAAGKLAVARVEAVWGKANTEPKWTEMRKSYVDAVTAADTAVKDPKTPKDQLQAKKDELATAKQALVDFNKKIVDARDARKGIPGLLSAFKSDVGIPETLGGLSAKLTEFRTLLDNPKPTLPQLARLAALRTDLTQVLNAKAETLDAQSFLKKSSKIITAIGLSIENPNSEIHWSYDPKIDNQNFKGMQSLNKHSSLKKDEMTFKVIEDRDGIALVPQCKNSKEYLVLPTKISGSKDSNFKVTFKLKISTPKILNGGLSIGLFPEKARNKTITFFGFGPSTGKLWHYFTNNVDFSNLQSLIDPSFSGGADVADFSKDQMITLTLLKEANSGIYKILLDNKKIFQAELSSEEYSIIIENNNVGILNKANSELPKIYSVSVEGKSLGMNLDYIKLMLREEAQSSKLLSLIMLPWSSQLASELFDDKAHNYFQNTVFLFVAKNNQDLHLLPKIYKDLYKIIIIRNKEGIGEMDQSEIVNMVNRALRSLNLNLRSVGKPSLLSPETYSALDLTGSSINNLNNYLIYPLRVNETRFFQDKDYRLTNLVVAIALSRGVDASLALDLNSDGSISVSESLINEFQNNYESSIALLRAA